MAAATDAASDTEEHVVDLYHGRHRYLVAGGLVASLLAGSVVYHATKDAGGGLPDACAVVDVATSSQKLDLLQELAGQFNRAHSREGSACAHVRIRSVDSGEAARLLAADWPETEANGPRPVLWSPASSAWGAIANQLRDDAGRPSIAPADARPFMVTPVVIALPEPMAEALGWPDTPIGYADLIALAQDPAGWGGRGHPEWGRFKLGKTNPTISTSGLSGVIAQYYAATAKVSDLTLEDVERPDVAEFNRAVESAVVHYGDSASTFLDTWYRKDATGAGLAYVSAVAVEEKRLIDYNRGDPDGVAQPGDPTRPPKHPLVAVYPKEGTLFSDNPLYVLDAPWVTPAQRRAARAFEEHVLRPAAQRLALAAGFRPGNPEVPVGAPIDAAHGVDPAQPQTTLSVPAPPVLVRLLERWHEQRKGARVLLLMDVSGSMGEPADEKSTKLELAQRAAADALELFEGHDQVGLRVFSTDVGPPGHRDWVDLVSISPVGETGEALARQVRSLIPTAGTPLYTATRSSYEQLKAEFDPERINAIVVLTDGRNEDPRNDDLDGLLRVLRAGSEGLSTTPVRLFTIGYGEDADLDTLRRMAEATDGAAYDASDPRTIGEVFTSVVSNF